MDLNITELQEALEIELEINRDMLDAGEISYEQYAERLHPIVRDLRALQDKKVKAKQFEAIYHGK